MTVQQGMDVDRVRRIAEQLEHSGDELAGIGATGRAQLSVLAGSWSGPDLDSFGGSWSTAERTLADASSTVRRLGRLLTEQAQEQEETSQGTGSVLGTPGLPGGPGETPGLGEPRARSGRSQPWEIPALEALGTVLGPVGNVSTINTLAKAMGAQGLGGLLGRVPALSRPVLSAGSRLGIYMQAQLTHPLLGRGAASLFSHPRTASLFNASRLTAFSKVLGGLGLVSSGYEVYAGIRNEDPSRIVSGGLGIASVAVPVLLGLSGPVGWGVAGGLAVGSFVAAQWGDEIGAGAKKAWDWTGDRLADLGDSAQSVAEDVGSVLTDPIGSLKGLFS